MFPKPLQHNSTLCILTGKSQRPFRLALCIPDSGFIKKEGTSTITKSAFTEAAAVVAAAPGVLIKDCAAPAHQCALSERRLMVLLSLLARARGEVMTCKYHGSEPPTRVQNRSSYTDIRIMQHLDQSAEGVTAAVQNSRLLQAHSQSCEIIFEKSH